jgi:hypothetical protein
MEEKKEIQKEALKPITKVKSKEDTRVRGRINWRRNGCRRRVRPNRKPRTSLQFWYTV